MKNESQRRALPRFGSIATAFVAALFAATPVWAQPVWTQEGEEPEKDEPIIPREIFPEDGLKKELLEKFHEVERKLIEIDIQLADAGAGENPLSEVEDSGLDDLLRSSQNNGEGVVAGIDRILEIAEMLGSQSMTGMGQQGQSQSNGESPLDQERDRGPQDRENTPEAPGKPKDSDDPSQQPTDDQEPTSPKDNPEDGTNGPAAPRQDEQGTPVTPGDDADAWGDLPLRFQETFRNQGGDDLPVQYRDWIDSYYRRLNERP